jgi:hypothetical protein
MKRLAILLGVVVVLVCTGDHSAMAGKIKCCHGCKSYSCSKANCGNVCSSGPCRGCWKDCS